MIKCMMCDSRPAKYVRITQFAGIHHFCNYCAAKEDDYAEMELIEAYDARKKAKEDILNPRYEQYRKILATEIPKIKEARSKLAGYFYQTKKGKLKQLGRPPELSETIGPVAYVFPLYYK